MKYFALVLIFISCVARSEEMPLTQNWLNPFTSDGCSNFPNGIPYFNENKWRNCCVEHDVAYWQGGTFQQREVADERLRQCVAASGEPEIAEAMYLGVRLGGHVSLPTSWHWGYGWVLKRPYSPLTPSEQTQVAKLITQIPTDLNQVPLVRNRIVPFRESLTGDYCLDAAVQHIENLLGRPFQMLLSSEKSERFLNRYWLALDILVDDCKEPFHFEFLLENKKACRPMQNEWYMHQNIRMLKHKTPTLCQFTK